MTSVLAAEEYIQLLANKNWEQFQKRAAAEETVDLDFWATAFAYDVVADLGLGENPGFISSGADPRQIMKAVFSGFLLMANLGYVPGQSKWFTNAVSNYFLDFFYPMPNAYPKYLREVGERVKARRELGRSERRDFLQQLFEAKGSDGQPLSHPDIMSEASNILGAGGDTTSIGLKACILALIDHPDAAAKLRKEIDGFFRAHGRDGFEISYNECLSLPYLQAFIKET